MTRLEIQAAGGDTATPLNLQKRLDWISAVAGPGLAAVEGTRGAATADFDGDGDVALVLSGIDAPPSLLRNDGGNENPWISFRLIGTRSNRDAVGARLALEAGGRRQVRTVNPFGSYQSQSSYTVHFGLGDVDRIERLVVRWPSGLEQEFVGLAVRVHHTLTEGEGIPVGAQP